MLTLFATNANATYNIALVLSDNGENQRTAEELKQGLEFAINEVNSNGGVNGQELKLRIFEDYCDVNKAITIANNITNSDKKYSAVIGHLCLDTIQSTSDIYNNAKLINIVPISISQEVKNTHYKGFFKLSGDIDFKSQSFVDYVTKNHEGKKLAILCDGATNNHHIALDIKEKLAGTNFSKDTIYANYIPHDESYDKIISQLQDMKVDIVYLAGELSDIRRILISAEDKEASFDIYASSTSSKKELISALEDTNQEIKFTTPQDYNNNPKTAPLISKLRIAGIDFTNNVILGYTSAEILIDGLKEIQPKEKVYEKIASYLSKNEVQTSIDNISFNQGNLINPNDYRVFSLKGHEYTQVK